MTNAILIRYDVVLETVEPLRVASIHGVVPSVEEVGDTFDRLFGILEEYVKRNGYRTGPPMAIFHDSGSGSRMLDMHVELAIPLEGDVPASEPSREQVRVYELPRVEAMAHVVYKGPYEEIKNAYEALFAWAREHEYKVAGPSREIYLSCGEGDSRNYLTEVQFPVVKEE
jgi:effector-binding domain-containing protein